MQKTAIADNSQKTSSSKLKQNERKSEKEGELNSIHGFKKEGEEKHVKKEDVEKTTNSILKKGPEQESLTSLIIKEGNWKKNTISDIIIEGDGKNNTLSLKKDLVEENKICSLKEETKAQET